MRPLLKKQQLETMLMMVAEPELSPRQPYLTSFFIWKNKTERDHGMNVSILHGPLSGGFHLLVSWHKLLRSAVRWDGLGVGGLEGPSALASAWERGLKWPSH